MFATDRRDLEEKLQRRGLGLRKKPSDDTTDGLQKGEEGEEPATPTRQGG